MKIRPIEHEVIPDCGSYEVPFPDGRRSKYFYFENIPGRRLRPDVVDSTVAELVAKDLRASRAARVEPGAAWKSANTDDIGAGNHEDVSGSHDPKGEIADYWDFDEDSHNGSQRQQDGYYEHPLETTRAWSVNADPK